MSIQGAEGSPSNKNPALKKNKNQVKKMKMLRMRAALRKKVVHKNRVKIKPKKKRGIN